MTQHQCARGHLYLDVGGRDAGCPTCAAEDAELSKTRPFYDPTPTRPMPTGGDDGATVGFYGHLDTLVDPVVGWVACVAGPDKGRDWRLVSGRNAIGRGDGMAVKLGGDSAVSRERHAFISFEPRRGVFSLLPGDSRGLVYCNGDEVTASVTLKAYDRIELGKSALLFVPLAGEGFGWDA